MKNGKTTGNILGELENQVMEIVWQSSAPLSVAQVLKIINQERPIAYTTVQTIMARLAEKGILTRQLKNMSYLYKPAVSRENFIARSVHSIFAATVSSLGQEAVLHFAKEIQNLSPQKQKDLLKMLEEK